MNFVLVFCLVSIANAASLFTINVKDKMSTDFLTGFESGIFLRNNTQQFDEYGCPDQEADSEDIKMFKAGLDPIRSITKAIPNSEKISEIIDSMELFVSSFDKFIGVFDKDYVGGDFCAGLTFGMQGATMLQKVATLMYEQHLKEKATEARKH